MAKEIDYEWQKETDDSIARCPRCQAVLATVNIHGHEQCAICHSIIDDCCQGEQLK
tara:strand:+ start:245 stop:412 length:168 start_codon:yes stop_codon:yes gene_type:complete